MSSIDRAKGSIVILTPVILCGGSGTRLWPRSRKTAPKPFLPLVGDCSLFEQALGRSSDAQRFDAPVVVTGDAHLELVQSQLRATGKTQIIVEPEGKNTAAAIALAAQRLPEEAIMLVCPSDHHIADSSAFMEIAQQAGELAERGHLVAFGIEATRPETGYGYIKQGDPIEGGFQIARFVEKPDKEKAQAFLDEGGFYWNGGIFAFRAGTYLEELARFRPALADAVEQAVDEGHGEGNLFRPEATAFGRIESESVDYAIMEQTDKAAMVPARMGWSDIGNWFAVREEREKDDLGNTARGRAELIECRDVMVDTDGPRVSVVGLDNVIVVVDGDEVLVTSAKGAPLVGKLDGAVNQKGGKS